MVEISVFALVVVGGAVATIAALATGERVHSHRRVWFEVTKRMRVRVDARSEKFRLGDDEVRVELGDALVSFRTRRARDRKCWLTEVRGTPVARGGPSFRMERPRDLIGKLLERGLKKELSAFLKSDDDEALLTRVLGERARFSKLAASVSVLMANGRVRLQWPGVSSDPEELVFALTLVAELCSVGVPEFDQATAFLPTRVRPRGDWKTRSHLSARELTPSGVVVFELDYSGGYVLRASIGTSFTPPPFTVDLRESMEVPDGLVRGETRALLAELEATLSFTNDAKFMLAWDEMPTELQARVGRDLLVALGSRGSAFR